jgi:tRNA U55 pseudouridine synthase TruB
VILAVLRRVAGQIDRLPPLISAFRSPVRRAFVMAAITDAHS